MITKHKFTFICILIGFLFGAPVPLVALYTDVWVRSGTVSIGELYASYQMRPAHLGMLVYPFFSAIVAVVCGRVLDVCTRTMHTVVRDLRDQAQTDGMTRLFNHTTFFNLLRGEIARFQREARNSNEAALSLILLDLDKFKLLNDNHGHRAGDAVLEHFARVIRRSIRPYDLASRYGGEEFSLILPDTQQDEALGLAERLRVAVEEEPFPYDLRVTVSVGVATVDQSDAQSEILPTEFVEMADKALYEAKDGGRNRVCVARKQSTETD